MLKILISNDDGVYAPGLAQLAKSLSEIAQITVVAPDRNRSGASNSLTLDRPLRIREAENGFYMVDGTPTDCVHLALTGFLDFTPDLVVSGINAGANLGDDTLYSGTVAAAMEGRHLGLPAVAFSLVSRECRHYETAGLVAKDIVKQLMVNGRELDESIINVNVPDVAYSELQGFEVTRCGNRHLAEPVHKLTDPRGLPIYWVGCAGEEQDAGPGTDFYAVSNKQVAITPLQVDLTRHSSLDNLNTWIKGAFSG